MELEDIETGKTSKSCRYSKAKVLEDHTAEGINEAIKKSIQKSSSVFTNQSTSYVDIASLVEIHISEKSTKQTKQETLKWVHIFISNAKRNLLRNYPKIKRKNL